MKMMLPRLIACAAVMAGASAAQAVVVDFESSINSANSPFYPLISHNDYIINRDFYVIGFSTKAGAAPGDLVGAIVDGTDVAATCSGLVCPTNNATNFMAALNDGAIDFQSVDASPFRLTQFSASFIAATGDAVQPRAMVLQVLGFNAAGAQVALQQFDIPGPTAGSYSFATYTANATFANTAIVELAFLGYFCTGPAIGTCVRTLDKAQFGLDNINLVAVPEPSQWLLMGLGLSALGALARKRTANVA